MQYQDLLDTIASRANISPQQAERALQAFGQTWPQPGVGWDISQLPDDAKEHFRNEQREPWTAEEFLQRFSELEGCRPDEAEQHSRAVWQSLKQSSPQFEEAEYRLPADYRQILA